MVPLFLGGGAEKKRTRISKKRYFSQGASEVGECIVYAMWG